MFPTMVPPGADHLYRWLIRLLWTIAGDRSDNGTNEGIGHVAFAALQTYPTALGIP